MSGTLSQRDSQILGSLFDNKAEQRQHQVQSQPGSYLGIPADIFAALRATEAAILRPINVEEPSMDAITLAIRDLSRMIDENSTYSSVCVNRAQVRRLLVPTNVFFTKKRAEETSLVMADLDTAIAIATPKSSSQQASAYEQSVLAAAHTHRGFLLMRAAHLVRSGAVLYGVSESLSSKDADTIDEMVFRDFETGGAHGDEEAAKMAVRTNPYAKLCGAIVSEAMRKEMEEYRKLVEM